MPSGFIRRPCENTIRKGDPVKTERSYAATSQGIQRTAGNH